MTMRTSTRNLALGPKLARPAQRRRRRGTVMLEFALLLPLFMFLVLFTVDVGRLTFYMGALNDATYLSARAASQYGSTGPANSGISATAFRRAIEAVPGMANGSERIQIVGTGVCTDATSFIDIDGTYRYRFLTPGLSELARLSSQYDTRSGWQISASASVRCEIVRN